MFRILSILFLLLLFVSPVLAQDILPPPDVSPVFQPPTPGDVFGGLNDVLLAIFAGAMSFPLTVTLVSVLKRLPFLRNPDGTYKLSADQINLLVAIGLSAVYWLGQVLGVLPYVEKGFALVNAILPILFGVGVNYKVNQYAYNAVRGSFPVVGAQRAGSGQTRQPERRRTLGEL